MTLLISAWNVYSILNKTDRSILMDRTFNELRYQKDDVDFRILTYKISKTIIKSSIAKIPKRYFKGIDILYFIKFSREEMYDFVSHNHHPGETDFNRAYHAMFYVDKDDLMKIAIYISDDFYRELNQTRKWIDMIRGAILHELGHYHIHINGLDYEFNDADNELLVDRFVERNLNMRLLMLVSLKKIKKFDAVWDKLDV